MVASTLASLVCKNNEENKQVGYFILKVRKYYEKELQFVSLEEMMASNHLS